MKKQQIIGFFLASALLASCGAPIVHGSSEASVTSSASSVSSEGGASSQGSSESTEEEYVIKVSVSSGLTLSVSASKAKAGETITVTVTHIEDGFLLKAIYMNGTALTGQDNVYTFVMPNRSVTITADVEVDGDVAITGGITAKLVEETKGSGLYVARNVAVPAKASFHAYAFGKTLGMCDIDYTKCLADIDSPSSSKDDSLTLAGGATYDFFYDDNADSWTEPANGYQYSRRFYIRRNTVTSLPSDVASLHTLFDGAAQAETTERVENLQKVTYTESVGDIHYVWNNYADGSLATVTSLSDPSVSKGVVYKQYKDGVLTQVDTYLERNEYPISLSDVTYEAYGHRAAAYGSVSAIPSGWGTSDERDSLAVTDHLANFEAHRSQHAQNVLRYSFQDAYYVGFDSDPDIGTDGLGLYDIKIASTATSSGFDVTLDSYREIDTTSSASTESESEQSYYLYKVNLSFNKAGEILSASYVGKKFGTDGYNFASHTLKDETKYTLLKDMRATYEYGEAKGEVSFDTSAYLTSSLTASVIDPDVVDKPKNVIAVTSDDASSTIASHLVLESNLGENALDLDDFKVIDVANKDLVALRSANSPFSYYPAEAGTTDVTVGIPGVSSAPKSTFSLTIQNNVKIHSGYLIGENGLYTPSQELLDTSTSFTMEAGSIRRFRVIGGPSDAKNLVWDPVSSDESLLKATYYAKDHQSYILFDASFSSLTEKKTVSVTLNCSSYDTGWSPTVLTVTLVPGTSFDYLGDWYEISEWKDTSASIWEAKSVDKTTKVSLKQYAAGDESTYSHIYIGDSTYTFGFYHDDETNVNTISKISGGHVTNVYIDVTVDGYLGVILEDDSGTWTGMDEGTDNEILLGDITYDEEGELVSYSFDSFAPAADWD